MCNGDCFFPVRFMAPGNNVFKKSMADDETIGTQNSKAEPATSGHDPVTPATERRPETREAN